MYRDVEYFKGHKGTHIRDGIYKLEEPFEDNFLTVYEDCGISEKMGVLAKCRLGNDDRIDVHYFAIGSEERGRIGNV